MSAVDEIPCGGGADFMEVVPLVPLAFNPTTAIPPNGRPVFRFPEQLRMHHALEELGWTGVIDELNDVARLEKRSAPESILITASGTILAGFGRWRLALLKGEQEIHCIEYPLSEEEALPFILTHHKPRHGWNAFVRIRVALTMEASLQQKALDNMRAGGKLKGWASLPEAQHLDVREQIASLAGACARYVSSVKTILKTAHPRLLAALQDDTLTINCAMRFCQLPKAEQLEQFIRYREDREINKVIRRSIIRPQEETAYPALAAVLEAIQLQETRQPGSIVVRRGRLQSTVILVGRDMFSLSHSEGT